MKCLFTLFSKFDNHFRYLEALLALWPEILNSEINQVDLSPRQPRKMVKKLKKQSIKVLINHSPLTIHY